jgi:hypothetical protein
VVLEFASIFALRFAIDVALARKFLGAALFLATFPTDTRAVILIEVIEPLKLFDPQEHAHIEC